MHIDILSLFPDYFQGPLGVSILKRAQEKELVTISLTDIRQYSRDRHRRVDDRPFGGGPGMVMMPEPIIEAICDKRRAASKVIYLSAQGTVLKAAKCKELARSEHLILLCGHYEGVDERVFGHIDEEIGIGDFVLTNGCPAALVLIDSVVRFIPGVLGHEAAAAEDSFEKGLLDWPHYTRPRVFGDKEVPEVLFSGNHKKIAEWRVRKAKEKTRRVRPDLWKELQSNEQTCNDSKT